MTKKIDPRHKEFLQLIRERVDREYTWHCYRRMIEHIGRYVARRDGTPHTSFIEGNATDLEVEKERRAAYALYKQVGGTDPYYMFTGKEAAS